MLSSIHASIGENILWLGYPNSIQLSAKIFEARRTRKRERSIFRLVNGKCIKLRQQFNVESGFNFEQLYSLKDIFSGLIEYNFFLYSPLPTILMPSIFQGKNVIIRLVKLS